MNKEEYEVLVRRMHKEAVDYRKNLQTQLQQLEEDEEQYSDDVDEVGWDVDTSLNDLICSLDNEIEQLEEPDPQSALLGCIEKVTSMIEKELTGKSDPKDTTSLVDSLKNLLKSYGKEPKQNDNFGAQKGNWYQRRLEREDKARF